MRTPSTTAPDFDSCRAGSACARRTTFSPSAVALALSALVAACLAFLAIASSAQASLNVSGYFGSRAPFAGCGCFAGEIDGPQGIAVNSGGNGAPAGTMYFAETGDSDNNRIAQYSPFGKFVRVWGADVVLSGPDQSDEVQRVTVDATGGSFKLTFGANTTADIPATATAGAVETALDALTSVSVGSVDVSGGPGSAGGATPYFVTFNGGALGGVNQPEMTGANGSSPLTGGAATVAVTTTNQGEIGFEICEAGAGDACKEGVAAGSTGAPAGTLGIAQGESHSIGPEGVSIDQTTGDVYVTNQAYLRVEVFSASGQFLRAFGNDVVASGPGNTGGVEVCTAKDLCKEGVAGDTGGAFGDAGDYQPSFVGRLAVVPVGAPNAGNVVVADPGNQRVQEFTAAGAFIRAFGYDVAASGPGDTGIGFEVCSAATDVCKEGTSGSEVGQFVSNMPRRLAVDTTGAIYTVERDFRVQKFSPQPGPPALSPSLFGGNETQSVSVRATGGEYRLSFGGLATGGSGLGTLTAGSPTVTSLITAKGTGNVSAGSTFIGGLTTTSGKWFAGEPITGPGIAPGTTLTSVSEGCCLFLSQPATSNINGAAISSPGPFPFAAGQTISGPGVPAGTTIESVAPGTLTLSANATASTSGVTLSSALAHNASAGQVQSALNALPAIKGSVTVTGGPGDASGSNPYLVTFSGGQLAKTNPILLKFNPALNPLTGGTGAGANEATMGTVTPGGPNGTNNSDGPVDVAIGAADHVFVSKDFQVGNGTSCLDGSTPPVENHVMEMAPSGAIVEENHGLCNDIKVGSFPPFIPASGMTVNPVTGFLYESKAPNGPYPDEEENRIYILAPGGPPTVSLDSIGDVSATSAVVDATLNPNSTVLGIPGPVPTLVRLEYKLTSSPTWSVYGSDFGAGSGLNPLPLSISLDGLEPNRSYEARLVVTKQFHQGVVTTAPQGFSTLPAAPRIEAFYADKISANSADLHALINPLGEDSTYTFEYGTTPAYGSSIPIPADPIPAGINAVPVTTHVTGLNGGVYHYRVVAKNEAGTSVSGDSTFTFYPPSCPNESVRQQTGASLLPDCRAYELVSPAQAGNVILLPAAPSAPDASNPSRLGFSGFVGGVKGSGNPTAIFNDLYVATRTVNGWVTRYTGLPGDEGTSHGGPPNASFSGELATGSLGSLTLDKVMDWDHGHKGFACCGKLGSFAPTLYSADGTKLTRLPTNVGEIPGGTKDVNEGGFRGDTRPSADFSHYVFSTKDVPFAAGGLTTAPGSVYDNDVGAKTVTIVSRTEAGDIPTGTGGDKEIISIPGVSSDGSHILMATKAGAGSIESSAHLYMSVDQGLARDVSIDQNGFNVGVAYEGMTADGESVYFSSQQQLTADDHDEGVDLFLWQVSDPDSLTRISQGSAGGDSDQCAASWTTRCGIQVVEPGAKTDTVIASESGDIYFYSPEQLVSGKGVPGQRNLYVYRDGTLRHVVALNVSGKLERIQVVPNGDFLAVLTKEKLTSYNNAGFLEMYTYDVDAGGPFKCVSCIPDGSAPTRNVEASQNGVFLSMDGRAFFTTGDPLVPEDINAKLRDVYEYVNNRPQLLSSGSSPRDTEIGGQLGLIGVSWDGVDVYFTTIDSLVAQDLNGAFLKFYDARTGGGFPFSPPPAPCQAADECHGPSSTPPPPVTAGTGVSLGGGGNAKSSRKKHKKKHKKKQQKRRHGKSKKGKAQS